MARDARRLAAALLGALLLSAAGAYAQAPSAPKRASSKGPSELSGTAAKPAAPSSAPSPAAPADPSAATLTDVGVLLDSFARMPGLEARFVEEKQIALLAKPLESKGRLFFARPGMLLRRVEAPRASEVVITPSELRMKNADGEQQIDLRSRADLRPFVESLVWLLSGNRKALADVYSFAFQPAGTDPSWHLKLTPKSGAIGKLIQYIQVSGRGLAVDQVEVREISGDATLTRIVEANPNRHFDAAELKKLFGVSSAPAAAAPRGGVSDRGGQR